MPLQDDHVFLYRVGEPHTHLDGYPKPVKEVLGLDGPIDAAFMCDENTAHIVKGKTALTVFSMCHRHKANIVGNVFKELLKHYRKKNLP